MSQVGAPRWSVETDSTAPSAPQVLQQSGSGTFPWCVRKDSSLADGYVEVKFKPMRGREDQAGGVVWRWKDANNYYVARANALENNVSLYYTQNGRRNTLKYVDAPVPLNAWHTLRAEFSGTRIRVALNGRCTSSSTMRTSELGRRRRLDEGRQRDRLRRLQLRGAIKKAGGLAAGLAKSFSLC